VVCGQWTQKKNQGLGSFLPCMSSALNYVTVVKRTPVIHDNLCERKGHISLIAGKQSLTADTLSSEQWESRQWKWLQRGRNDVWSSSHAAVDHLWLASEEKLKSRIVRETISVLWEGWRIWNLYQADEFEGWLDRMFFICSQNTRVGTLIVTTIYLQLIQNRYMFRSFTVLHCSHQHCLQPVASDVEVVGYL